MSGSLLPKLQVERAYGDICVASSHGDCLLRGPGFLPRLLVDLHVVLRPAFLVHRHSEAAALHYDVIRSWHTFGGEA